jgi:ATP-dependent helicase/nuclease subunit A
VSDPRPHGPTPEQAAAVDTAGVDVALTAGAGCGKTRVLTERYVRALDRGEVETLPEIIALTFTEKAAREMRERVRRECRRRRDSGPDAARWRSVVRFLEAAPISTFHSHCATVLRRHPLEAGVEPGFAIAEETIAATLRAEALSDCLRRRLADRDEDLLRLASHYGLPAVREALSDLLAARAGRDYAALAARSIEQWIDAWQAAWTQQGRRALVDELVEQSARVLDLLKKYECSNKTMRARVEELLCALSRPTADLGNPAALGALAEQAIVRGGGGASAWPSEDVYQQVKAGFESLRKAIRGAIGRCESDDAATREAAEHGLAFARLAADAVEAYAQRKRSRGVLDFDDLQAGMLRLLREGPPRAVAALRDSIRLVLVDEFQDTDPVQAEILRSLVPPETPAIRLFLVGDVKQSIYGFRGAQPKLLDEFASVFPADGRLRLSHNFRSATGLIDFVNALFAETFSGDDHRLVAARDGSGEVDGRPRVELLWASDFDGDGRPPGRAQRRAVEARWIANHLARRLAEGWLVRDREAETPRRARAGDVALLFRTLNDAAPYERALADAGLDFYIVGGKAFFAQQEVLDLINVLACIEDPGDELALVGSLRSPFFGVSDEGLFWLARARPGGLPEGLAHCEAIHDLANRDRQRAARAHRLLESWRALKDHAAIAAILDRVLEDSGYEAALLVEPLGDRKRANCRKLVRLARRFDAHGGLSLADFVERLKADFRTPPREDQAATTDELGDAVRLLTVHQAKGLEFPIVVLPDLDRDAGDSRDRVAYHPALGLVVRPTEERESADAGAEGARSLGSQCLRALERADAHAEALRIFYVASTRARDALVLSAGLTSAEAPRAPALRLLTRRFDPRSGACVATLPDGWPVPVVRVITEAPRLPEGAAPPRRRRPRSSALRIAATIERAVKPATAEAPARPPGASRTPPWIDLDPARVLTPGPARLDALIREALAQAGALPFAGDRLREAVERAARILPARATPRLIRDAQARLTGWLAEVSRTTLRDVEEVVCGRRWSVSAEAVTDRRMDADDQEPVPPVFHGRLDLAVRAGEQWTLFGVRLAETPPETLARERLRLALSAVFVGAGESWRGHLVALAEDGSWTSEAVESFTRPDLGELIRAAWASVSPDNLGP